MLKYEILIFIIILLLFCACATVKENTYEEYMKGSYELSY